MRRLKDSLPRVEINFRAIAYKDKRVLTKSTNKSIRHSGEYVSEWIEIHEEEVKINDHEALIAKIEKRGIWVFKGNFFKN